MRDRKRSFEKTFFALSALASVVVCAELVMQFLGTSICQTAGCTIVAQHVRYGDKSILFIGLAAFLSLSLCSLASLSVRKTGYDRAINLVLIVSLACEGYFTGYQAFSIHTPCVFCLIMLAFFLALGGLRLLAGETEVLAGFVSLAAVFSMFYLVLPATATVVLPEQDRLVLFYSKECKHCAEVMKDLEENHMPARHLEVGEYSGFLKSMGIEHVPTLFVNEPYQKMFLTGKEAIKRRLLACAEETAEPEKAGSTVKSGKAKRRMKADNTGVTIDIFNQGGFTERPGETTTADGMCREDELCKD